MKNITKDIKTVLTGSQKVAIFLVNIGQEIASEIFKHMKEDEIEKITLEISRNENISSEQRDQVMIEFQELMIAQDYIQSGGIEFARKLLEKSFGVQRAVDIISSLTARIKIRPFDYIRRTDPVNILNLIREEHPQTIALILSHLEPTKAAIVLSGLDAEIRSGVTKRIAEMGRVSPEILQEVERVLEKKFSSIGNEEFAIAGGIDSLVDIMGLVDRATEKRILETLEEENPDLAEEIKKRMLVFEDIVLLSDRDVQKVLRELDSSELAKALKGVDEAVRNKIFDNMSKRASTLLREDIEYLGPIRLKDVEEMQQKIVSVIRKLEEQGEIIIARAGEEEMVV